MCVAMFTKKCSSPTTHKLKSKSVLLRKSTRQGRNKRNFHCSCGPPRPRCGLGVRSSRTSVSPASPLKFPVPNGRGYVPTPEDCLQRHCSEDLPPNPPDLQQRAWLILAKRKLISGKNGGLPRCLSIYALFCSTTPSRDECQGSLGIRSALLLLLKLRGFAKWQGDV